MGRALRVCGEPGCIKFVASGRCAAHHRTSATYDRDRGSAASRGYDAVWRRLRLLVLRSEPLCREHRAKGELVPATQVDHITPLRRGGTNERTNLQPLCDSCHSRKTRAEATTRG